MLTNVPRKLLDSLQNIKGFDEQLFLEAHTKDIKTSIRINPKKRTCDFDNEEKIPWAKEGRLLRIRPNFAIDPLWHAGAYYVQEASSMFLEHALKQCVDFTKELTVLDACAAPGGKSTHVASLLNEQSLLISNEVISTRVHILVENISKWGYANTWVTNNDVQQFTTCASVFDIVLVDAPCSGSGLFRKDKNAIQEWSEDNVQLCSKRQQRILHDLLPSLCNEGILVYMTCSFSKEENEDILDALIKTNELETIKIEADASWNIVETTSDIYGAYGYRFMPHLSIGEGFYIAVLKKKGAYNKHIPIEEKWIKPSIDVVQAAEQFISVEDKYILSHKENIFCINLHQKRYADFFVQKLRVIKKGVLLGQQIRKDLIPDQELANSMLLKSEQEKIELDYIQAIQYLKKDSIVLEEKKKGWYVASYKNNNLGWLKHLSNRINNYFPTKYRLRKDFIT